MEVVTATAAKEENMSSLHHQNSMWASLAITLNESVDGDKLAKLMQATSYKPAPPSAAGPP